MRWNKQYDNIHDGFIAFYASPIGGVRSISPLGSASTEEESRSEKIQERINGYQYIIDSAYTLFNGKYSMYEIEHMPYKDLLKKIEKEQENIRAEQEARAERERQEKEEMQRAQRYHQQNNVRMR